MIKGLSSPQRKRMVSLKDLKPKIHEKALGPMKQREERKGLACQDKRIKESLVERTGLRSSEVAKGSGSSGRATQLRLD